MTEKKEVLISEILNILRRLSEDELTEHRNDLKILFSDELKQPQDITVYISESAFWSLLLSAIEVYRRECFGILLGSYSYKEARFNIQYAISYQSARRGYSWVKQSMAADKRIREFLENLPQLELVGHFHSHSGGPLYLSETDTQLVKPDQIMLLIEIKEKVKFKRWRYHKDGTLSGTVGDYAIHLASYYVPEEGERERKAKIICPYGFGFQDHLKVYKDIVQ